MDQHVGTSLFDCCLTFNIYFDWTFFENSHHLPIIQNSNNDQKISQHTYCHRSKISMSNPFAWPPNIRSNSVQESSTGTMKTTWNYVIEMNTRKYHGNSKLLFDRLIMTLRWQRSAKNHIWSHITVTRQNIYKHEFVNNHCQFRSSPCCATANHFGFKFRMMTSNSRNPRHLSIGATIQWRIPKCQHVISLQSSFLFLIAD